MRRISPLLFQVNMISLYPVKTHMFISGYLGQNSSYFLYFRLSCCLRLSEIKTVSCEKQPNLLLAIFDNQSSGLVIVLIATIQTGLQEECILFSLYINSLGIYVYGANSHYYINDTALYKCGIFSCLSSFESNLY